MLKLSQLPKSKTLRTPRLIGRGLTAFWVAIFLLLALDAEAASFTASLDRDTIALGESATLTLAFEGGAPGAMPSLPALPNLQIFGQGQSSQYTIVNGQVSSTESHTFGLTPTQPGEFNFPALSADINGQTLKSQPLKLTVLKPGTPSPAAGPASQQLAFLKMVLPRKQVYVGETFQVQLELYLREGVQGMRDFQMTPLQAEGFTVGKMVEGQQHTTRVGNVGYTLIPLTMPLTAVKVGNLTLGPAGCTATLLLPPLNFFGQPTHQEKISQSSEPVALQVLPLPRENVPPGFNGAVGNFTLTASVSPTNVAIGDPITIKIQINGHGGVDAVTLPDQPAWQQFKLYPPTSEFAPAASDPLGITGTKSFALTAVPESMDIKELPPFSFSFFDPDQKAYRTLTQPAVPLTVRPSAASLPPAALSNATAAENNSSPAGNEIVHIKPRLGVLAEIRPPLVVQSWFVALQGIPVLAWVSLLISRKQKEKLARNPRLRRQRQVEQIVRAGLQELRQSAAANQREAFFATLFHLLQEQLGERLDLPASSITEAIVSERLRPLRVPEATLVSLHELFQTCNQARYAQQSTNDELVSLVPKVESAMNELKKIQA